MKTRKVGKAKAWNGEPLVTRKVQAAQDLLALQSAVLDVVYQTGYRAGQAAATAVQKKKARP